MSAENTGLSGLSSASFRKSPAYFQKSKVYFLKSKLYFFHNVRDFEKTEFSRFMAFKPVRKTDEGDVEGVVNHRQAGEGWSFTLKAASILGE